MTTISSVGNATDQTPAPSSTPPVTPMRAGSMGAAFGLGVGLLFGELIVPGVIIAVVAGLGIASMRSHKKAA